TEHAAALQQIRLRARAHVGANVEADLPRSPCNDCDRRSGCDARGQTGEGKLLAAVEAEGLDTVLVRKQQWDDPDSDQVGAMDALERAGDHRAHAEQGGALRRPVAAAAGAEVLPAQHDQRNLALAIAGCGLEYGDDVALRVHLGPPALAPPG